MHPPPVCATVCPLTAKHRWPIVVARKPGYIALLLSRVPWLLSRGYVAPAVYRTPPIASAADLERKHLLVDRGRPARRLIAPLCRQFQRLRRRIHTIRVNYATVYECKIGYWCTAFVTLDPNSTTRTPATDTNNGRAHNNSITCCTTSLPHRNARAQRLDMSRSGA